MATMRELTPGRVVFVPAGCALLRRPFALYLSAAAPAESPDLAGMVWMQGQLLRADGSAPRRYRIRTTIAPADRLRVEGATMRRCMVATCPAAFDVLALMTGQADAPGWLQTSGVLGGCYVCPTHAPTMTDGQQVFHRPAALHPGEVTCSCGALCVATGSTRGACIVAYGAHLHDVHPARRRTTKGTIDVTPV
ncbi:hypothetical protein ACFFMN_23950 [Planobispora siamensis]|uniref:Uncharacterized protein n=1 Tax=Planobispora siamensis TaxID=936338 RepID=A0A8J3SMP2_9ACTN|nr:hypothetical protein [Planobispora siamensis]GIH95391.1 hypothetical protein Psi01_60210 [Planobispora siamensis]